VRPCIDDRYPDCDAGVLGRTVSWLTCDQDESDGTGAPIGSQIYVTGPDRCPFWFSERP